jgi:hypothetical protein
LIGGRWSGAQGDLDMQRNSVFAQELAKIELDAMMVT